VATLENVSAITVARRRDISNTGNQPAESLALQRSSRLVARSNVVRAVRIFFCYRPAFRVARGLAWRLYRAILCAHSVAGRALCLPTDTFTLMSTATTS